MAFIIVLFCGDSWPFQLKASICYCREGGAAVVEDRPITQNGGHTLLPWEMMARHPMHANGEPILQNLNPTRNFVYAIRSTGQGMTLVSKGMDVVEALHFVLPSRVVTVQ